MPMRQIHKHPKKSLNRKSHTRKQRSNSNVVQRGGDDGRFVLPPAYFGKGMQGYYADGSSEFNSCGKQHAVSHGVISANGKWAGPNLYPMMGGSCGCSGKRQFKPKTMKGGACPKKSLKTHQKGGMQPKKSKSQKNKSRKH